MTKEIRRELTAIMFTDIVGFTALSAKDEKQALSLLDKQREVLFPIIDKYNGSVRKEIGDGLLITFRTASESVRCGIEIQSTLKSDQELKLRISIHEGEVAVRGNDVLGDDVNIASRLEPYSAVGGIVISGRVQQNISSLPEYKTEYMGHPALKGVTQSVDVYCITSNNLPMGEKIDSSSKENKISTRPRFNIFSLTGAILTFTGLIFWIYIGLFDVSYGSGDEVPSVAILMMENLGDAQDGFWARGITEDLIVKLAGAGLLRVASIQQIKKINLDDDMEEIAKNLNVRYILYSSIFKNEGQFDLKTQLIDVSSGISLLGDKWSEPLGNAPKIVGLLASDILDALDVKSKQNIEIASTENLLAYELYLKGKQMYLTRQNMDDTNNALDMLNRSISLDPYLIEAKIQLGWYYYHISSYQKSKQIFSDCFEKSKETNNKVMMAASLKNLGNIEYEKGAEGHDAAMDFYKQSVEISKAIGDKNILWRTLHNIAMIYEDQHKFDLSFDYINQALSIAQEVQNQKGIASQLNSLGLYYKQQEKYDEAILQFQESSQISTNIGDLSALSLSQNNTAQVYILIGKLREAEKLYLSGIKIREDLNLKKKLSSSYFNLAQLYYDIGMWSDAIPYYNKSFQLDKELGFEKDNLSTLGTIGICYTYLGELDRAYTYLKEPLDYYKKLCDVNPTISNATFNNFTYYYWSIIDMITYYEMTGDLKSALQYSSEVIDILEKIINSQNEYVGNSYKINLLIFKVNNASLSAMLTGEKTSYNLKAISDKMEMEISDNNYSQPWIFYYDLYQYYNAIGDQTMADYYIDKASHAMQDNLDSIPSSEYRQSKRKNDWYFKKISEIMSKKYSSDNSK